MMYQTNLTRELLAKIEAQSDVRWNGDAAPTSYFPNVNNVGVRPEEVVFLNLKDNGMLVYGRQLDSNPTKVGEEEFLWLCRQLRPKMRDHLRKLHGKTVAFFHPSQEVMIGTVLGDDGVDRLRVRVDIPIPLVLSVYIGDVHLDGDSLETELEARYAARLQRAKDRVARFRSILSSRP